MKTIISAFLAFVLGFLPVAVQANASTPEGFLNAVRANKNLSALIADPRLEAAAKAHTEDMIAHGKLSHEGSDGSNSSQRIKAQGFKGCFFAENIASVQGGVSSALELWMNSKGHRANILNPKAQNYGLYGASGYWTLTLAAPC